MRIAVVMGTRPEIIKMSPVIRELERRKADFFIVHTGQHYSYVMDRIFFEQLKIPAARYHLEAGSGTHAEQTAVILKKAGKVLEQEKPDIILVEGDTNTVLAGALAAAKLRIKIGHLEAGLRSYDRHMPEEINRILTDHCADYLFAPTEKARQILTGEGIAESKISVTGNTIVDAVFQNLEAGAPEDVDSFIPGLKPRGYFLATLHRQENVDDPARFGSILRGLDELASIYALPVVYPVHPRARKRMAEFDLRPLNLTLIEPVDFLGFLSLEKNARLVLTDSGGVQEESCILGVPCVTLRDNTERPETLEVGANMLAGTMPQKILACSKTMLEKNTGWRNPFGDGKAAEKIVSIISGGNHG